MREPCTERLTVVAVVHPLAPGVRAIDPLLLVILSLGLRRPVVCELGGDMPRGRLLDHGREWVG